MADILDRPVQTSSSNVPNPLHAEYLATTSGATKDPAALKALFSQEDQSNHRNVEGKLDSLTRGDVYEGFLTSLGTMHQEPLTHDMIQADKQLPIFNNEERRMLDFTDRHFDELATLDGQKRDSLTWEPLAQMADYPTPQIHENTYGQSYADSFELKGAIAGGVVGTAVEAATFFLAPGAAAVASCLGGGVGGFVGLSKGEVTDAVFGAGIGGTAWGPALGATGGYLLGAAIAQPYWNHTQGKKIAGFYNEMKSGIPTYDEFKAST